MSSQLRADAVQTRANAQRAALDTPAHSGAHAALGGLLGAGYDAQSAALRPGGGAEARLAPQSAPGRPSNLASAGPGPQLAGMRSSAGSALRRAGGHMQGFSGWETKKGSSKEWGAGERKGKVGVTEGGYDFDDLSARLDYLAGEKEDGNETNNLDARYGDAEAFAGLRTQVSHERTVNGADGSTGTTSSSTGAQLGVGVEADGYVAGWDAWRAGGKMGVGGRSAAHAGAKTGAAGGAAGGVGPAIGSVDPLTGERRNLLEGHIDGHASVDVGARAGSSGEAYVEGTSVGAAGQASASIGGQAEVGASGGGSVDVGGLVLAGFEGSTSASAGGNIGAQANGQVKAGATGVLAEGSAGVEGMVRAEAGAEATSTLLGASVTGGISGQGEAGATAGVAGGIGVGLAGTGVHLAGEAFAGARASVTAGGALGFLGVDVISGSVTGTVAAGIGGAAGGGIMIKDGILTINLEVFACKGVGGGLEGTVQIDLLSPFKMVLGMLESNAIISSNPETWLVEIIDAVNNGGDAFAKRVEGRPDREPGEEMITKRRTTVGTTDWEQNTSSAGAGEGMSAMASGFGSTSGASVGASAPGGLPAQPSAMVAPTMRAADASPTPSHLLSDDEATAKLLQAHALTTEASASASDAVKLAMQQVKDGLADPMAIIGSILENSASLMADIIRGGALAAANFGYNVLMASRAVVAAAVQHVLNFLQALFTGGLGKECSRFDAQKAQIDGEFAGVLASNQARMDEVGAKVSADVRASIQNALTNVATDFVAASGDAAKPAQQKATRAKALIDEVAAREIVHDDGSRSKVDASAGADASKVVSLLGQMGGAAQNAGGQMVAAAAPVSASAAGASSQLAETSGAEVEAGMRKRYEEPAARADAEVKEKKGLATAE